MLVWGFVFVFFFFFLCGFFELYFLQGHFTDRDGWETGDGEVRVLIFKTLCYVMNSLLIVNMQRKVGVFVPLASLQKQICF